MEDASAVIGPGAKRKFLFNYDSEMNIFYCNTGRYSAGTKRDNAIDYQIKSNAQEATNGDRYSKYKRNAEEKNSKSHYDKFISNFNKKGCSYVSDLKKTTIFDMQSPKNIKEECTNFISTKICESKFHIPKAHECAYVNNNQNITKRKEAKNARNNVTVKKSTIDLSFAQASDNENEEEQKESPEVTLNLSFTQKQEMIPLK